MYRKEERFHYYRNVPRFDYRLENYDTPLVTGPEAAQKGIVMPGHKRPGKPINPDETKTKIKTEKKNKELQPVKTTGTYTIPKAKVHGNSMVVESGSFFDGRMQRVEYFVSCYGSVACKIVQSRPKRIVTRRFPNKDAMLKTLGFTRNIYGNIKCDTSNSRTKERLGSRNGVN